LLEQTGWNDPARCRPDNRDGDNNMWKSMRMRAATVVAATALAAAGIVSLAGAASALPGTGGLALKNAAPSSVESVRWGGRGYGPGAFVAGAILGGALLAPRFYGPRYYGPGPYYYGPGPYYVDPGYVDPGYADPGPYGADPTGGDPVAYCLQRFRSYDPRSGTYLGYDGYRHPCP
jgi:hypothetical protein